MTDRPLLERGDRVRVTEAGIEPWRGIVNAIKFSKVSGWWVEVERAEDGMVLGICLKNGTAINKEVTDGTA
jgi:hypothetical protein